MLSPGAEMWHRNVLPQGNNPEQSKLFWAGICKQTPLWQGHLLIISVTNFYLCLSVTHRMTAQSSGRPHVLNSRTAILFDILTYLVKKKQKTKKEQVLWQLPASSVPNKHHSVYIIQSALPQLQL